MSEKTFTASISPDVINASITNTLISSFISSSNNFTKQLTTVILMSSIEEIKNMLRDIFTYVRHNFKDMLKHINPVKLIEKIFLFFQLIKLKFKKQPIVLKQLKDNDSNMPFIKQINIECSCLFVQNIMNFATQNKDTSKIILNDTEVEIVNRNEINFIRELQFISIKYNDMIISSNCNMKLTYDTNNNISSFKYITDKPSIIVKDDIKSFGDIIENNNFPVLHSFLKEIKSHFKTKLDILDNDVYVYIKSPSDLCKVKNPCDQYPTWTVSRLFSAKYATIDRTMFTFEFDVFFAYCYSYDLNGLTNILHYRSIQVVDNNLNNLIRNSRWLKHASGIKIDFSFLKNIDHESLKIECNKFASIFLSTINNFDGDNQLSLNIENFDSDIFSNFIKDMNVHRETTDKIKIYEIKMIDEEKCELIDNITFVKLKKKINELNKHISDETKQTEKSDKNNDNVLLNELKKRLLDATDELSEMPDKITEKSIIKKLECKYITEKNKPFSTLYLRKKEKEQLVNIVETYHTNKKKLIDLGLPDKLGIMLEGLPGTGKTSTIWAIATALKKNIYYIHLNTVKTNEQLTQIFDYINNETSGGIVVFEDIDAMTNVVLKRDGNQNNGSLTLAHILNLFQGTLTKDGTMFIVTTNFIKDLDPAFCRDGRFDLIITMQYADRYQCSEIYYNFFKKKLDTNLLNKLPEDTFVAAKFIFFLAKNIWDTDLTEEQLITDFLKEINTIV